MAAASGDIWNEVDMPLVLIGDPVYPMCSWLLNPYGNREAFTEEKAHFNYRLNSVRMTVENVFGRFKGRWRRFTKITDGDVNNNSNFHYIG